jgi:transcriptional regulator with XRE-family HTH domain
MNLIQVGQKIRELRANVALTQDELAAASGLTVRSIQRIENGRTIPRGDSLKRLASALNVPVESLTSDPFHESIERGKMMNGSLDVPSALILSAFCFLIHPVLGVVFPMLIWLIFRKDIEGVQEIGLKVVRLEAFWCCVLTCVNAYIVVKKIFHLNLPVPSNVRAFAVLNIVLYIINALVLVIYLVRWLSSKKKSAASLRI